MSEEKKVSDSRREPSLWLSLAVIVLITFTVSVATLHYNVEVHAPILMLAIVIALISYFYLHIDYKVLEKAALNGINTAMPSCVILVLVGMMIGLWIKAGVIPGIIYYGLNVLSPTYFPLATLVICMIISLSTGSSWSTEATIGVAMLGIGAGLGVPAPMTAGCVVSGAYFGDKMSPLSDTTNLAPAVAGNNLFDHVRAMCWTTIPTLIITMIVMWYFGRSFAGHALDTVRIQAIQTMIAAEFPISLLCLVPPLAVIISSVCKIPAMPGICLGIFISLLMCLFQGVSWGDIWNLSQNGYKPLLSAQIVKIAGDPAALDAALKAAKVALDPKIAVEACKTISKLVGRGGMMPMMWSVLLAINAMAMGGFLEEAGMLRVLLNALTKGVRRVGGLIATTIGACFVSNLLTGSQYLSIIIPGRMFKTKYEESGLAQRMLSRSLEDCGTMTSVLIPWNACGGYAAGVLGVSTLSYAPYAVLNWLNPLMAILLTYIGFGVFWRQPDGSIRRENRSLLNMPAAQEKAPVENATVVGAEMKDEDKINSTKDSEN